MEINGKSIMWYEYKIIAIAPWNLYQSLPHKKGVAKVTSFGLALSASFDILNISRGFTRKKRLFHKGAKKSNSNEDSKFLDAIIDIWKYI